MSLPIEIDPALDLVIDRVVPVPPARVYKAWTTAEHLKQWFCPKPWYVSECELELRPGGRFFTVMNGPQGERFENLGCFLELVPDRKLVFTDALLPGFRPAPTPFFTAFLFLEPVEGGTRYIAIARHGKPETVEQHRAMGFFEGWGTVIDQLVATLQAEDASA